MRPRVAAFAAVALALLSVVAPGSGSGSGTSERRSTDFSVAEGELRAPDGSRFVVEGVAGPYPTFVRDGREDHGGFDVAALRNSRRDVAIAGRMGANLVRVFVTPEVGEDPGGLAELDRVVSDARAAGMVVLIANSYASFDEALPWVRDLAERYAGDPYVWLTPMNEPNCAGDPYYLPGECERGWGRWRREHQAYLDAIREAGFTAPVLVNTVRYSWDLRKIDRFPLSDPVGRVIYGAHRYGNDHRRFSRSERRLADELWADRAAEYAVVADEIGAHNGSGFRNDLDWNRGLLRFARGWVANRGGDGLVAFAMSSSDRNSILRRHGYEGDTPRLGPGLSAWGRLFRDEFLERVDGARG
jgi:hypothetical protein